MDVCFEFDASSLDGSTLVAFETLMKDGKTVAEHVDLEDPEQTVFVEKTRATTPPMRAFPRRETARPPSRSRLQPPRRSPRSQPSP